MTERDPSQLPTLDEYMSRVKGASVQHVRMPVQPKPEAQQAFGTRPQINVISAPHQPPSYSSTEGFVEQRLRKRYKPVLAVGVATTAVVAALTYFVGSGEEPHKDSRAATALPGTSTSDSPTTETPSESPTASEEPAATGLVPVPADVKFDPPECVDIKVQFVNNKKFKSKLPVVWDLDFNPDNKAEILSSPYMAQGKVTGSLMFTSCLTDMTAIEYNDKSSKLAGKSVFTVDMSKALVTPEPIDILNGVALNKDIDTESELYAALLSVDPEAPIEATDTFTDQIKAYGKMVGTLTLYYGLKWTEHYYGDSIEEISQDVFLASLEEQIQDKDEDFDPESVMFVPDLTVSQDFKLNINLVNPDELTGPFTTRPDLAEYNLIVTRADTGEQIQPEEQP